MAVACRSSRKLSLLRENRELSSRLCGAFAVLSSKSLAVTVTRRAMPGVLMETLTEGSSAWVVAATSKKAASDEWYLAAVAPAGGGSGSTVSIRRANSWLARTLKWSDQRRLQASTFSRAIRTAAGSASSEPGFFSSFRYSCRYSR